MKKIFFVTFIVSLALLSCTILKRHYLPGYYVHKNSQNHEQIVSGSGSATIATTPTDQNKNINTIITTAISVEDRTIANETSRNENSPTHSGSSSNGNLRQIATQNDPAYFSVSTTEPASSPQENADLAIGLMAVLAAICGLGLLKTNDKTVSKLARWAKGNSKKSIGIIAVVQILLSLLALVHGNSMRKMGFEISDALIYSSIGLMLLGLTTVPFMLNRNTFVLPEIIKRRRIIYLLISVCSMLMCVGFGNRLAECAPDSNANHVIQSIDHAFFGDANTSGNATVIPPVNPNARMAAAGMTLGLAILLYVLLSILICAGLCITGFGVAFIAGGEPAGIFGIILGPLVFWLAIKGIVAVSRKRKATIESVKK